MRVRAAQRAQQLVHADPAHQRLRLWHRLWHRLRLWTVCGAGCCAGCCAARGCRGRCAAFRSFIASGGSRAGGRPLPSPASTSNDRALPAGAILFCCACLSAFFIAATASELLAPGDYRQNFAPPAAYPPEWQVRIENLCGRFPAAGQDAVVAALHAHDGRFWNVPRRSSARARPLERGWRRARWAHTAGNARGKSIIAQKGQSQRNESPSKIMSALASSFGARRALASDVPQVRQSTYRARRQHSAGALRLLARPSRPAGPVHIASAAAAAAPARGRRRSCLAAALTTLHRLGRLALGQARVRAAPQNSLISHSRWTRTRRWVPPRRARCARSCLSRACAVLQTRDRLLVRFSSAGKNTSHNAAPRSPSAREREACFPLRPLHSDQPVGSLRVCPTVADREGDGEQ